MGRIGRRWRKPSSSWSGSQKTVAAPERPAAERLHLVDVDSWDECAVPAHPDRAQVWRRTGQPLTGPAAGDDHQLTVFGAVDDASGQILWQTSACKGEDAFLAFLDHLVEMVPANEPAVRVLDNASYHKSPAVRAHWQH